MDRKKDKMTEKLLHLSLEIIYRLTGEDYTVVKKTPIGLGRPLSPITDPPPHPPMHKNLHNQKILELTYKMIELLTGEVPLRCQDVTVHFSKEEWQYLEGHKELYEDVMMDVPQPLTSPDIFTGSSEELQIFSDFKLDYHSVLSDSYEEPAIIPDMPSVLHSKDLLSDIFQLVLSPISLNTVEKENFRRNVERRIAQTEEKPFSCLKCKKRFKHKSSLVAHQRIHTEKKSFSCRKCGRCFGQKADLVTHAKSHKWEKPFICSECGMSFSYKRDFDKHKRTHKGGKPYKCPECGKCFTYKGAVKHRRSPTTEKPLPCPECGKYFNRKVCFVEHQRIHEVEKPFSCSKCGKCFNQKAGLVEHQRTHTKEKPFLCSECGKGFNHETHLVAHQRIHTREKPFSCSECGKSYSCKAALFVHLRTHSGEKPFSN